VVDVEKVVVWLMERILLLEVVDEGDESPALVDVSVSVAGVAEEDWWLTDDDDDDWPVRMPMAPRMARMTAVMPRVVMPMIIHFILANRRYQGSSGGVHTASWLLSLSFMLPSGFVVVVFASSAPSPPSPEAPAVAVAAGGEPLPTTNSGGGFDQVSANW